MFAKVFGIGLNRTGNTSLAAALRILGLKTANAPHDETTRSQVREGDIHLSILREYDAITDFRFPWICEQLDNTFPNSGFILTVRDLKSWLDSCERHWHQRGYANMPADHYVHFNLAAIYGCIKFNRSRFELVYRRVPLACRQCCSNFVCNHDGYLFKFNS